MRFRGDRQGGIVELDMTPMIDMTFQLIAFFMLAVNFTESEQDERIKLPISELAKPTDQPLQDPIFLQLTREGSVIWAGQEVPLEDLPARLRGEAALLEENQKSPTEATIVIRGDQHAKTAAVQRVMQVCKESRFQRFALRAREDDR